MRSCCSVSYSVVALQRALHRDRAWCGNSELRESVPTSCVMASLAHCYMWNAVMNITTVVHHMAVDWKISHSSENRLGCHKRTSVKLSCSPYTHTGHKDSTAASRSHHEPAAAVVCASNAPQAC